MMIINVVHDIVDWARTIPHLVVEAVDDEIKKHTTVLQTPLFGYARPLQINGLRLGTKMTKRVIYCLDSVRI